MNILGISCFYHDAAAVLLKDGHLVAAAEEERFSRKKHDFGFPKLAIKFVLEEGKITAKEIDYVVFYEKPFLKFERIFLNILQHYPKTLSVFREAMLTWLGERLWIKSYINKNLPEVSVDNILFVEHHISHAASSFLCSPFEEAGILTEDGVGELATTTIGVGRGNKIELLKEINFPHSIGLLYSAFTAFCGFEVNEGEYKLMGMSAYGKPKYVDKIKKLVEMYEDGSFKLNMKYFSYHYSIVKTFNKKFELLFGKPREPETPFFTRSTGFPTYYEDKPQNFEKLSEENEYYADIASSIQCVTEELIVNLAREVYRATGLDKLCIAGGVGLNSLANYKILQHTPIKEIFVQPAAGDSGGALGAALYVYNSLLNNPRKFVMEHAYWGKEYNNEEIKKFLVEKNIKFEYISDDEKLFERIVENLVQGNVIGFFQGKFEWGPRALGNRSILADARNHKMKDIVNTKIKFREPFRPFAPSVLAEKAEEYFEISDVDKHYPSRFMLYVVNVKKDKKSVIPAVTHVDGTARLQTVFRRTNPRYYRLIEKFEEKTGVPVILNTSFNLRGEPIVNTPENAYNTFIKSEMDGLVLGNYLVIKDYGKQN